MMEDSVDSDVVLVVPPSVDDSNQSLVGEPDGPLGITSKPLDKISESADSSFSCFQLSGREQESQSESSESLHIDDAGQDIIPSSPGVMHIELAGTPSVTSSTSTMVSHEICEDVDMDSAKLSPELIPSSDFSSADMMSSNPQSHQSSSPPLKTSEESEEHVEKSRPQPSENPFEIDTQTYSPSNFLMTPEKDQEQEPSSFTFLQKISCRDSHPSPVILAASTQGESENIESTERDTPPQDPGIRSMTKSEEFTDIDSKEIMIKDVEMRSTEEANSPQNELENTEENEVSPPEVVDSQAYTQEDLNLHLTFESQLFGTSSLPNTDSQALVIDEQLQSHSAPPTSSDPGHNMNLVDQEIIYARSHEDSQKEPQKYDVSQRDNSATKTGEHSSNIPVLPSDSDPPQQAELQADAMKESSCPHPVAAKDDSDEMDREGDGPSSIDTKSKSCDLPLKNDSLSAAFVPPCSLNSPIGPEQECESSLASADERCVNLPSSASIAVEGTLNSVNLSLDQPLDLEKDSGSPGQPKEPPPHPQNGSKLSLVPPENSQCDPITSTGPHENSQSATVTLGDGSFGADVDVSLEPEIVLGDKHDMSPSMQSTYVDENNNQAASRLSTAADNESMEVQPTADSSQPAVASYDASVEDSSPDSGGDVIGLPLEELETQPYSMPAEREMEEPDESALSQDNPKAPEGLKHEVKSLVNELIDLAVEQSGKVPSLAADATVDIAETLKLNFTEAAGKVALEDREADKSNKTYDFRSQSQPSQDIQLKSQFLSPSKPPVKERSAGKKRIDKKSGKTPMESDGKNNAEAGQENVPSEEHDKSSDTLPPDDGSGQDSDPLLSPSKENLLLSYRVTKYITVETICNGKVIGTRNLPKKVKVVPTNPYPPPSSQSSNGSGYLADTSSISRTSSDSSTQTCSSQSPGTKARRTSVSSLPRDASGSSSSSGLSMSSTFLAPSQSLKSSKSPKESKTRPHSSPCEKAASPVAVPSSPSKSITPSQYLSLSSPPVKESMVLLTPLSDELIAASTGTMGAKFSGNIATPPTSNINPPLSGSTPVETPEKDDLESDIETSNSPEIPYPDDLIHGSSFPFDQIQTLGNVESPKQSQGGNVQANVLTFGKGIPVMARVPTETYFYPGMMKAQDPISGKYTVLFEDDGKERTIRESDVLLIDNLNVGQEVSVQSDSDDTSHWYTSGVIVSYWRENDERGYVIEKSDSALNTKKGRRYSRKSVIVRQDHLTKEQKLSRVQPLSAATSADVSLNNIVDGKRRTRRSRFNSPAMSSSTSSQPGTPSPSSTKTPKSSRKRRIDDSPSSGSSSSVPFPSTKQSKRAKLTYGSSKTPTKKRRSLRNEAQPMYTESSIFEKCTFLMTSTTGRDQPSSELESPPSEPSPGYDRVDIRKKILAGSGKVAKNFAELMSSDRDHRYVISDNFCRTMKYLSAVGAGIDCLSYLFINDSTNIGKLEPTAPYKLPAGYSLQHQAVVERPAVHIQPLSGQRIHLQMRDISTWSPLLILSGCSMVSSRQDTTKDECPLMCDFIVADASCSTAFMNRAKLLKIPVISIEWVIQCLITSEKLPIDGHPQYTMFK